MTLTLGTRGSQLALLQAQMVVDLLRRHTDVSCEVVVIKTSGDRLAEATLAQIGGKRLFVKEIEDALINGEVDLAVHSSKDMPAALPPELDIGAVLAREDARDAIVLPGLASPKPREGGPASPKPREGGTTGAALRHPPMGPPPFERVVAFLGRAPRIGTSSVRRSAQLLRLFPGARFLPIRGNLDTRLRKLDAGDFDALVLAAAGLKRLKQEARISALIPVDACVPAPGQGIIAVEIRSGDVKTRSLVAAIDDAAARAALDAERAVVTRLGGGCQMPIGAYAAVAADALQLSAVVLSLDGARAVRGATRGDVTHAHEVGTRAAEQLLAQGAAEILADVQQSQAAVEGLQP